MEKPGIVTCECCDLDFTYPTHRDRPRWCGTCRTHVYRLGESPDVALSRATAHEAELRRRLGIVIPALRAAEARAKRAEEKDLVAIAYRSRDSWRDALTSVMAVHGPKSGRCSCGLPWPCASVKALERANPGIAADVDADLSRRPID